MLTVTDEIKNLYKADSTPKSLRISFYPKGTFRIYPGTALYSGEALYPGAKGTPKFTLTDKDMLSNTMTITESLCNDSTLNFRSCNASKCSLSLIDVSKDVYGYDIEIVQTIGNCDIPLFTGNIDTAKIRDNRVEVTAYDYLYYDYDEDMTAWYDALPFPMTLKEFRLALYEACHIPYDDVELVNDNLMLNHVATEAITGRELIAQIGECNGAFAHVNRLNKLTFVAMQRFYYLYPQSSLYAGAGAFPGIQTSSNNLEAVGRYISCTHEPYKTREIEKLVLKSGDSTYTAGEGVNLYNIKDSIIFDGLTEKQTALNNMLVMVTGLPYVPHQTELKGLPYVEVGDILQITTNKTVFETYVLKRTLKGVLALRDIYVADGEEYHNTAYAV